MLAFIKIIENHMYLFKNDIVKNCLLHICLSWKAKTFLDFFFKAQETYEKAMEKAKKEHERNNASPSIFPEYQLWEDHWIR